MHLAVDKKSPLGVKEQIKRQIRLLVESGRLDSGQPLPSAKDLAALLSVNRNTVALAYRELSAEGILRVVVGSGTFVREGRVRQDIDLLGRVYEQAFNQARDLGFTDQQTADYFLSRLSVGPARSSGKTVLVVDCNHEVIDHVRQTLTEQLEVETKGLLIQELEEAGPRAHRLLEGIDLVVSGFNHLEELYRAVPQPSVEVVAFILKTDIRMMNELWKLPPGTRVAYVCANQRSSETLFKTHPFTSGSSLIKVWVGAEDPEALSRKIKDCQVVFATSYVVDLVQSLLRPDQRLIRVDLSLDPGNIDLVREKLSLSPSGLAA